jgi:hypothetical protein
MRVTRLRHEFVEFIPEQLERDALYISISFTTTAHLCCCGCGSEVVTPLSPTDWQLTFDGESITLHPSIGNWNFACQSHYWIRHNIVEWAPRWSQEQISLGRGRDRLAKKRQFGDIVGAEEFTLPAEVTTRKRGFVSHFMRQLRELLKR